MAAKPGPLRPHEERQNYTRPAWQTPPPGQPELGDSFLIVTEGAVTEKLYFESVRAVLQINPVTVRVVHPNRTDAEGLVREAMSMYERDSNGRRVPKGSPGHRDVPVFDHVWVLFDTDIPNRQGQLSAALELARREGIHIGHSTPSVEFWLLLHFRDRPGPLLSSVAAAKAINEAWGQKYCKSSDAFPTLWAALRPNVSQAVHRAVHVRDYHKKASTPSPADPSTELDLLVRALNMSVQPPLRIVH